MNLELADVWGIRPGDIVTVENNFSVKVLGRPKLYNGCIKVKAEHIRGGFIGHVVDHFCLTTDNFIVIDYIEKNNLGMVHKYLPSHKLK